MSTRNAFLIALLLAKSGSGLSPGRVGPSARATTASVESVARNEAVSIDATPDRRGFLASALGVVGAPTMIALTSIPSPADARDELFRPNPLTNPLLEQVRIMEQAEKDNIKYGGELERGDAGNKGKVDAYPSLLVPILKIDKELNEIRTLVRSGGENKPSNEAMSQALAILQQPTYEKVNFKKTFNKYGDNIYYSDPDRANLYLGGGATPKTEQSIAYLLRNDVLTNMENLRAELEYLIKSEENEIEDLYSYADICTSAMKKYLAQVPPQQLKEAERLLSSEQSS
ncbi:unnamed protein product [Pseudo-nitzschia multistriata]|uniref:Uncharacterized protein n=1 Tax=Pseudo-nitzschia multistriata TaxID=183589 RepID=A0A448ZLZ7_9STRA|nr:unnamed protein product [Pseudo-nitzschia multistriata]VEU44013.1 unnamed protein product [Pseudo-nitzschia multistriata]